MDYGDDDGYDAREVNDGYVLVHVCLRKLQWQGILLLLSVPTLIPVMNRRVDCQNHHTSLDGYLS